MTDLKITYIDYENEEVIKLLVRWFGNKWYLYATLKSMFVGGRGFNIQFHSHGILFEGDNLKDILALKDFGQLVISPIDKENININLWIVLTQEQVDELKNFEKVIKE